jgi:hypothetical protein
MVLNLVTNKEFKNMKLHYTKEQLATFSLNCETFLRFWETIPEANVSPLSTALADA